MSLFLFEHNIKQHVLQVYNIYIFKNVFSLFIQLLILPQIWI